MPPEPPAPLLVVLTGPTGTGKSALAMELAADLDGTLPVEIVSVDSAQVYRGLDIGTAKPDRAARARVAHHLIDIRDPFESYSAGDFVREARSVIDAIHARSGVPLLVGGTMLYLRALRDGLATLPPASPQLRSEIDALAAQRGWAALHAQLAAVDAPAAARIAPQDAQRIQRALEVFRLTGVPISQYQRATHDTGREYRWLSFALWPASRQGLRARLAQRFEAMMRAGLLEEVQALHARGDLTERHPSVRAVGYRQLWQHCAGRCSLEDAIGASVVASAQLAKRQLTWLRRDVAFERLEAGTPGLSRGLARHIQEASGA
ncbi:MAG TPA: tRNA (adenosine(37)-N6)-dimethylallyltransferase MiaA [Steroidobacteraceae bacterium]|nr:tRNA (adenosine(37)-N6)-dimethylallyltransferase MiaA [Steroidobacteraceae bacterium]